MIRAVLFDVDFTLIYPGPMFRGEGYRSFCERYGITVDPRGFDTAVASAAPILDGPGDAIYDAEIFVRYTRHIIEQMGGRGDQLDACAREIYAEWAACQHFELYEEVPRVLRTERPALEILEAILLFDVGFGAADLQRGEARSRQDGRRTGAGLITEATGVAAAADVIHRVVDVFRRHVAADVFGGPQRQ